MCTFDVIFFFGWGRGGRVGSFVVGTCVYVYLSLSLYVYEGSTMKTSP